MLTQRRVRVADEVLLAVRERSPGTPSGNPVVLVHGWASTSRLWDGVARQLAAGGRRSLRVHPYPGAHHDVHLQRPAEVADDIASLP